MDAMEAILTRRSTRRFANKPIPKEALEALLAHREACERASAIYVRRFGALRKEQAEAENGWAAWSNTPWPWEKEAN